MKDLIRQATIAGLLHDIGKVLHRGASIDGRSHSISGYEFIKDLIKEEAVLEAVRYHHHQEITGSGVENNSLAYVVYLADNISSGADRREVEGSETKGFDKNRALESIYNLLNNSDRKEAYKVSAIESRINYPGELEGYNAASDYNHIIYGIKDGLQGIDFNEEYINSLLEICEAYLLYIPSSTYLGEVSDISLYDHGKITAAFAACILLYLKSMGREDYKLELFDNRHSFYDEKAFCMFSCDISGIQQFIYNISSKGALKGLRARSFYLEMLLENLADEIISACSLYRTNLIYTGGGHAYILLPNTETARSIAIDAVKNCNNRLTGLFGDSLYVAYGLQECSANELMSKTDNPDDYRNIFRSLSAQISETKLRRYSAEQLRQLNHSNTDKEGRECMVCGISSGLAERTEGTMCGTCAAFTDISNKLIKKDAVFAVTSKAVEETFLPLFSFNGGDLYFVALDISKAKELLQDQPDAIVRIYSKNVYRTGLMLSTKIWLGDYAALNDRSELKTFEELSECSEGIGRIGVLRADVDNMGAAFISGFIRDVLGDNKYRYLTLSRTATLSRSLSVFFKYYINDLLENGSPGKLAPSGKRNVVIVYSGGDDLFLVGAWNEVLSAAMDIRKAFNLYTGGSLTISAGFGIYDSSYPISRMAAETALMENCAKKYQYNGKSKNSISLFGLEAEEVKGNTGEDEYTYEIKDRHTYDWDTFENKVIGEKYEAVMELFSSKNDYGSSFLYSIIDLLKKTKDDTINIARLAYLLARREPEKNASEEMKKTYRRFSGNVYNWALREEDRRQLITAMIFYTYYYREKQGGKKI